MCWQCQYCASVFDIRLRTPLYQDTEEINQGTFLSNLYQKEDFVGEIRYLYFYAVLLLYPILTHECYKNHSMKVNYILLVQQLYAMQAHQKRIYLYYLWHQDC